jgi:hypothetical protein
MDIALVTFKIADGKLSLRATPHEIVKRALKRGDLAEQPCCVCGATFYMVAHHEDYSKPNVIAWLCKSCHVKRHRELGWGVSGWDVADKKRKASGRGRCHRCNGVPVHGTKLCRIHYREWTEKHSVY